MNATAPNNPSAASYLVIYNIMKDLNFGFLMRTASALGVTEIVVIGKRHFDVGGACGTNRAIRKRHFHDLTTAVAYLRSKGCSICGIEITPDAVPVNSHPFRGSTAFMVGNESSGLSESQMQLCDYFVYIPQFGAASCVNVNVAAGIVLHHFSIWAQFPESPREGYKFVQQAVDFNS